MGWFLLKQEGKWIVSLRKISLLDIQLRVMALDYIIQKQKLFQPKRMLSFWKMQNGSGTKSPNKECVFIDPFPLEPDVTNSSTTNLETP